MPITTLVKYGFWPLFPFKSQWVFDFDFDSDFDFVWKIFEFFSGPNFFLDSIIFF